MYRSAAASDAAWARRLSPDTAPAGERLKAARSAAGLTLAVLAERMGTSPTVLSKVENGHKVASLEWLYEASVVLQCPPSSLDPRLNDVVPMPQGPLAQTVE